MPRGMHPNSRKALEENRKNTMFHRESAVEAQKNSTVKKLKNRTFREEFEIELQAVIRDRNGNETTVKNAITKAAVQKALKGDLRAQEFIRDTIGEKPSENIVVSTADPDVIKEIEAMVYDSQ